jgi:hypothetical protein
MTANGRAIAPLGGQRILLSAHASSVYLSFPVVAPSAVRVQGVTPGTNLCLTNLAVGYPFPAR